MIQLIGQVTILIIQIQQIVMILLLIRLIKIFKTVQLAITPKLILQSIRLIIRILI